MSKNSNLFALTGRARQKRIEHQAAVLKDRLQGLALIKKMRSATTHAPLESLDDLRVINAFILWHLAFCPKANDRRDILNQVAIPFETRIDEAEELLRDNPTARYLPIPHSPIALLRSEASDPWPKSKFSEQWRVPGYAHFCLPEKELTDVGLAYNYFRLALISRGRDLSAIVENHPVSLLGPELYGQPTLIKNSRDPLEQIYVFPINPAIKPGFIALLVKNRWPIGYAAGHFPGVLLSDHADITFHMFHEARRRDSRTTLQLFILFQNFVNQRLDGRGIAIRLDLAEEEVQVGLPSENVDNYARFLAQPALSYSRREISGHDIMVITA